MLDEKMGKVAKGEKQEKKKKKKEKKRKKKYSPATAPKFVAMSMSLSHKLITLA